MPPKPPNKKAKLFNSRAIRADNNIAHLRDGLLSVPEFLESREYEIRAFELSQLSTKAASSTRVFQALPRSLRRRAASHNVKRIPPRLRRRAIREMQGSSGVPPRKPLPRGRQLYRLRMQKKLLRLASKVRGMRELPAPAGKLKLREKLKILESQIKSLENTPASPGLNNKVGAYDNTGIGKLADHPQGNVKYAKRQHDHVWLPSHIWHAKRFHMIKKWGYQIPSRPTQKCYRAINRQSRHGCIAYDTSYYGTMVIQAGNRFNEVLAKLTKFKTKPVPAHYLSGQAQRCYDDWLYTDECVGKGLVLAWKSTSQILVRVHPLIYEELFNYYKQDYVVHDCRYAIGSVEVYGPTSLCMLSRILHLVPTSVKKAWANYSQNLDTCIPPGTTFAFNVADPRYWKHPVVPPPADATSLFVAIANNKPTIDGGAVAALFDPEARNKSYENQKSVKDLGQKFARIPPSTNAIEGDEKFPVVISKLASGAWTVLMPWYWVLPTWIKLAHMPKVMTGGLRQAHQVNFENHRLTFPADYPYLKPGWVENQVVGVVNEAHYNKLSRGKRTPYAKYEEDALAWFNDDWTFLRLLRFGLLHLNGKSLDTKYAQFDEKTNQRKITSVHDIQMVVKQTREERPNDELSNIAIERYRKSVPFHQSFVAGTAHIDIYGALPRLPVKHIRVELESGNIGDHARIYANGQLVEHLIGFVTSGAYNLSEGKATGVGLVSADFAESEVVVRNVGHSTFHSARAYYI